MDICFGFLALLAFLNFTNVHAVKKCGYGRTGPDCDECGKVFLKRQRIIGGKPTVFTEWPSVVFIQFNYRFDFRNTTITENQNCTGTLINKRTVLTTTACFNKQIIFFYNDEPEMVTIEPNTYYPTIESMYKVYLGINNLKIALENKQKSAVRMNIDSFKIHPKFDEESALNDVVIIRLSSEVEYSNSIQPACLPNRKIKNYPLRKNIQFWAVGWGITDFPNKQPRRLQKVILNRYSFDKCENVASSTPKNPKRQLCAGSSKDKKGPCYGDGGAPLFKSEIINGVEKFVIAGMASYGEGCAKKNIPGVFTKVSFYLDWIEKESVYDRSKPKTPDGLKTDTICTENFNDGYCDVCGKQFQSQEMRILGGTESKPNSWPSTVFITIGQSENLIVCGGTLINRDTVLTGAYCTYNLTFGDSTINVYLGTNDITLFGEEGFDATFRSVKRIIMHPNFIRNNETKINDIAILKLSEPVELSERIQPACLPPNEKYPGKFDVSVYTVGWGQITNDSDTVEALQRYVELTLYEGEKCSLLKEFNSTSQICAGELKGGKGPCDGDNGGPLYYIDSFSKEPRHVLAGITSFGNGCGIKNKPGSYSNVGYYLSWIRENML